MRRRPSAIGLHAALAALGVAATLAAGSTVAALLVRHAGASVEACRGFLSHLSLATMVVAALAVVVAVVVLRAIRGVAVRLRVQRKLRGALLQLPVHHLLGHPVRVLDGPRPVAFCAGLVRPCVALSTGALERLTLGELRAVLAHERHHAVRRDPLRRMLAEVLAEALFFLPVLRPLAARGTALAELRADAAAIDACGGDVRALASALLTFEEGVADRSRMIDPERIDHLAGIAPVAWRPPARSLAAALGALAALLALPVVAVEQAIGTALELEAFGMSLCLAALVAAPFALAAAVAAGRGAGGTVAA